MNLIIKFKPQCDERPWLIVREDGEYEQHAHLRTKKEALKVRNLIDRWVYPYNKNNEDQFIMTTITTYNAVIQELEHIIKKAELYGAE